MNQHEILAVMVRAAKVGGNQALAKQGMIEVVADDGGGGLTTAQDHASQASINEILEAELPGINILGEEKPDKKVTDEDLINDPIDGSYGYSTNGSDFSCTLAHTKNRVVDAAVIWQPRTGVLVTAVRGDFLKVEQLELWPKPGEKEVSHSVKLLPLKSDFNLKKEAIQMPIGSEFSDDVIEKIYNPLIRSTRFIRNNICNTGSIIDLLLGRCVSFIGYGSIWDFAAGILFIEQFGGVATDYWGKPIDMSVITPQRVVLSRSQTIHDTIIPLTKNWPTATEMRPKPESEPKSEPEALPQDVA